MVASGWYDHMIKLWDIRTGKELQTLEGDSDSVSTVVAQISSEANPQISVANDWVALGNKNLIWLPAQYHAFCCLAIQPGTLALGYRNGTVLILGFSND